MGIFDFIKQELLGTSIKTIEELNKPKNKDLRYGFARRSLQRALEVEPVQYFKNGKPKPIKSTVINKVRKETGLKFSNAFGRETYDEFKQTKPSANYGAKLRNDVKPVKEKVPLTVKAQDKNYIIKDEYLYTFDVYVRTKVNAHIKYKKKTKLRNFPNKKNYIRINSGGYMTKEPYVYYSGVRFSINEINEYMIGVFTGRKTIKAKAMEQYIEESDVGNVFSKEKIIVGFKYKGLVRN